MKTLSKSLCLLYCLIPHILIGFLLTGCDIIDTRSELAVQVDELLDSPSSELWEESKGRFYYPISNGAIRVKSDGEVSLITDLDGSNNYSIIVVTNPNGTRAAKVAKNSEQVN